MEFTTRDIDASERLAAWCELVNREFLPLAITPLGPAAFEGTVISIEFAGLRIWRVRASPMQAVRAGRHISSHDDYLLALHVGGVARATQDDRQVTLKPGDLAMFDSSRPYTISFPHSFEHLIFQVPRARLRHGAATALRVAAGSGTGQLVSPYLRTLADLALSACAPSQAFVDTGLDLAAGALRSVAPSAAAGLMDYALARLDDPDLSPQAVAAARYISVRQLHRLFVGEGVTFGAWVREQRLRRCHDDLADPALSVAEIAARHGFRSAAHFSRAFRARYGVTPGSARRSSG